MELVDDPMPKFGDSAETATEKCRQLYAAAILTCSGGAPSPPPPPAPPPEAQDAGVVGARDDERRRRRAAASQTFLTSQVAKVQAPTMGTKTLLGA